MLSTIYGRLWTLWQRNVLGRQWFVSCDVAHGPDCADFQAGEPHRCGVILCGYLDRLGTIHITNQWPTR